MVEKKATKPAPKGKATTSRSASVKATKAAKPAAKKAAKPAARKTVRKPAAPSGGEAVSKEIDQMIQELGGWRGETLANVRRLIKEADPEVVEEIKWRKPSNPAGVPVWSHEGIICTGESLKNHMRLTFPKGSEIKDPAQLFNSGLAGVRRAIQLFEGDEIDEGAFKALIREAIAVNIKKRSGD